MHLSEYNIENIERIMNDTSIAPADRIRRIAVQLDMANGSLSGPNSLLDAFATNNVAHHMEGYDLGKAYIKKVYDIA